MKTLHLPVASSAMAVLLLVSADKAGAQVQTQSPSAPGLQLRGMQVSPPAHPGHMRGFRGFFPGFFYVEPEVVHDVVVVHDPPAESPAPPPSPPPRKPFVLGRTYAALPGSCMKMIDRGTTYYQCSGEWYRQVPGGRNGPYLAVVQP